MKQLKFFLMAFIALCFTATAVQAQDTTKTKTQKTGKHEHTTKYQCPMKCEGDKTYDHAGKCPKCNMNLKEVKSTSTAFQCPMKCEGDKTYAQAGKCPVCNMNLKEVKAKEKTKEKTKEDHSGHSHS